MKFYDQMRKEELFLKYNGHSTSYMKYFLPVLFLLICSSAFPQGMPGGDSIVPRNIVVHKDPRIDLLIKKQVQINEETTREARKNVKGFRLLVINTNNRDEAMAAKSKLYTHFPELRSYLIYQSPYFKLKAGNFKDRKEAEDYRKKIAAYFPAGVFVINDIIEVKLNKPEETTEQ